MIAGRLLEAVNLIFLFPMMIGAIGFMIGTGGSALVSMNLGKGKAKEANEIALLLGATPDMVEYSVTYGRFLLVALPFFMVQNVFRKSIVLNISAGVVMTVLAIVLSDVLAGIFVSYDAERLELTKRGFIICSLSFLVTVALMVANKKKYGY